MQIHDWSALPTERRAELLLRPAMTDNESLRATTASIVGSVRSDGDTALRQFTRQFDGAELDSPKVSDEEIEAACEQLNGAALAAIDTAIVNVRRFHEPQQPVPIRVETVGGVLCERLSHPLDSVGLYVPAGTAPLPSAAIMLAVPARLAGCPRRVLCTPPRPDGSADPAVITAAVRAGVSEIYKIGGAQAIAAMAYGTETVPKVRKIFGPGNAWVTCAKTLVSGDPHGAAIDMPAGPSEVLVIADDTASPANVAADLLSQAEHGVDSQVILVTDSASLARSVVSELERQLATLPRAEIASQALNCARLIVVCDIQKAVEVSNTYAPEHLIVQTADARALLPRIRNAGSVFLGPWTPESAGDYCSGTNHVLPTYGHAATYSGLGVDAFMRAMTVQEISAEGLRELAPTIVTLAELEGLDAHAAAVRLRLGGAV